jgi:hypothetical protein
MTLISSTSPSTGSGLAITAAGGLAGIPTVIYDVISSMITTRERLIIIERICSSFHKHSINGFGWQHNIDLLFPQPLAT